MSWKASQYVCELGELPDGTLLSRGIKAVLLVLAHHHNVNEKAAWPSLSTIAVESGSSTGQVKRDLVLLESHGVIRRITGGGAGVTTRYQFPSVDDLKTGSKTGANEPVSNGNTGSNTGSFTGSKPGNTGSKTGSKRDRNKEEEDRITSNAGKGEGELPPMSLTEASLWTEKNFAWKDFCRQMERVALENVGVNGGVTQSMVLRVARATGVPDRVALAMECGEDEARQPGTMIGQETSSAARRQSRIMQGSRNIEALIEAGALDGDGGEGIVLDGSTLRRLPDRGRP